MEYNLRVDFAEVDISVDDYKQGELETVSNFNLQVLEGKIFNDVDSLVSAVNIAMEAFSDNKVDYIYIDGRIDTDASVNADYQIPSEDEYELWKRGELTLYNAHLAMGIMMVPTALEHRLTTEEAESFGLPIY